MRAADVSAEEFIDADGVVDEETMLGRRAHLPAWLKVDGEWRGRSEFVRSGGFVPGHDHQFWLNRLRLGAGARPLAWMRLRVEGADARLAGPVCPGEEDAFTNSTDIHEAYVEIGGEAQGASARVGRMELAFGDERLIGADRKLSPFGQAFDGVLGNVRVGRARVEGFTAKLVAAEPWHMDRREETARIYGVYTTVPWEGLTVEPYLFVVNSTRADLTGTNHIYTVGARSVGPVAPGVDYNVEAAWQTGDTAGEHIVAQAAHVELGWKTGERRRAPAVSVEYNYGSGDGTPGDGRHGSFNDLYPAGFNRFGMADSFAWINMHNVMTAAEWTVDRHWTMATGYRSTWVAQRNDGVYFDAETRFCANPGAESSHVGQEIFVGGTWKLPGQFRLAFGYSVFLDGRYLATARRRGHLSTPYVSLETRF